MSTTTETKRPRIEREDQAPSMMSRAQFCELAGISLSGFHALKRAGKGPEHFYILRSCYIVKKPPAPPPWSVVNKPPFYLKSPSIKLHRTSPFALVLSHCSRLNPPLPGGIRRS
jgi:hypothetical protein